MNEQISKRLKSLLWRASVAAIIIFVSVIVEGSTGLGLPLWAVGLISLIGGEITKYLNTTK